jgi:hypothetical protein
LNFDIFIGRSIHYFYNRNGIFQKKGEEKISNDILFYVKGWFIIKKNIWQSLDGMKTRYKGASCEDRDFFLRAIKNKNKIYFSEERIAIHHTVSYLDNKRMWSRLFNGIDLYGRSVFYRNHFFKKNVWLILFRHEYTLLILLILIMISFFSNYFIYLLFYPIIVLIRIIFQKNKKLIDIINRFPYYFLRDLSTIFGFFFFYPSNKKNIQYVQIL